MVVEHVPLCLARSRALLHHTQHQCTAVKELVGVWDPNYSAVKGPKMQDILTKLMEASDTKKVLAKISRNIVQPITAALPSKHIDPFTQWTQSHKQDFLQAILALPLSPENNPALMLLTQNEYGVISQWILLWAADLANNPVQRALHKSPTVSPGTTPAEAKDIVERSILALGAHSEVEAFWSGTRPGWVTAPLAAITHPSPLLVQQPHPKPRTLDEVLAALATQESEKDAIPAPAPAPTTPQPSPDPATLAHTLSTLLVKPHAHQGQPQQSPTPSPASSDGNEH